MISVKTAKFSSNWIHHVEVIADKISDSACDYVKTPDGYKSIPHPEAGMPTVQVRLYGPRGGPKDWATFTRAQAKELANALLVLAEEV